MTAVCNLAIVCKEARNLSPLDQLRLLLTVSLPRIRQDLSPSRLRQTHDAKQCRFLIVSSPPTNQDTKLKVRHSSESFPAMNMRFSYQYSTASPLGGNSILKGLRGRTQRVFAATSLFTYEKAPTTEFSPNVTPGMTMHPMPIAENFLNRTGLILDSKSFSAIPL